MANESDRLNQIASDSWYAKGANGWTTAYSFNLFKRFLKGPQVLELGPAEGVMTDLLAAEQISLTVVEGSSQLAEALKKRLPNVKVYSSLFENFKPETKFDTVLLGHVLEHVENPSEILKLIKAWLNPGGRVICAVPNSRSLHRQAAVIMGLLPFEEALNDADRHHGHRRVYNPESFRREFLSAGYRVAFFGGYWLKPLSNSQFEKIADKNMVDSFMQLGERYPDIAAEIVIVAE